MSQPDLETLLENTKPTLDHKDKVALWQKIETRVTHLPVPSPYTSFIHSKIMTSFFIALALIAGGAGTVAASERAMPGDLLFPIERAAERTRIALASNERAAELRSEFAAKRMAELQAIIAEEQVTADATSTSSNTKVSTRGEERISLAVNVMLDLLDEFEDREAQAIFLTALMAEINAVTVANSEASTSGETRIIIDDDRIELGSGSRLELKSEDDDSSRDDMRDDDRIVGFEAEADVFSDITIVEVEINDRKTSFTTSATTKAGVVAEIVSRYGLTESEVQSRLDFEIEDRASHADDTSRDDDRDDDSRSDDTNTDDSNDSDDRDDNSGSSGSSRGENTTVRKFEVEVENGQAEVKVEYGDNKLEYETRFVTTATLVAEVALRTGLSIAVLPAALDLEIID